MLRALLPFLVYSYVSLIGLSTRWGTVNGGSRERLRQRGQRFIYAFWHQRQVFFTWTHRDDASSVLVSRSKDGDIIADTMRLSRIHALRGSSSRGGVAAARELVSVLSSGRDVGVTPDGPRGPARRVKEGVLRVAQLSGCPILPLTNALSHRLELAKAWDRFHVPLPFGRGVVVYGEPIWVRPDDALEAKAAELAAELDRITEQADRLVS